MSDIEPEWHEFAACRGQADLFMITDEESNPLRGGGRRAKIAEAKAICATCPVIELCAEEGMRVGDFGVWGGMSQSELRHLKKEARHAQNA